MVATRFAVAVHILLLVGRQRGGPATSRVIAASVNTNPVVVRRIMGQLARAGLVRVRRGPGGAELARPSAEITLFDVWMATRTDRPGPMLPLHATPNPCCAVGERIQALLGETFATVERAMHEALRGQTLACLADRVGEPE